MTNRFLRRVVDESIIDTRKYRYTYNAGNGNIERLSLEKLNTTDSLTDWEVVAEMPETYIDTEEIESVTIGTDGLELNFSDVTSYYIETDVTPDSGYINVNDIKGWEAWNDNEKVYLSVDDWVISKEPYTTNTKAERME